MRRTLDYLLLILYTVFLYFVWRICAVGGLRHYVVWVGVSGVLLFICAMIKLICFLRGERSDFFRERVIVSCCITIVFAALIVYAAIPYHGRLSWAIDDLRHHKKAGITNDNLFETGIEGFFSDIDKKIKFPEKLYVSDDFSLTFDEEGKILTVDTVVYGRDRNGKKKSFLISYDAAGKKADVYTGVSTGGDFPDDKLFSPLLEIMEQSDCRQAVSRWNGQYGPGNIYGILYYGKRSFRADDGVVLLDREMTGAPSSQAGAASGEPSSQSGTVSGEPSSQAGADLWITGYEVSVYMPENQSVPPVRYMTEAEYTKASADNENGGGADTAYGTDGYAADTYETDGSVTDADGTVTSFVQNDKKTGYRLVVTDAAAGSRFYELKKTMDSGRSWTVVHSSPFGNTAGVAEGIVFFNEKEGFIGLAGASGEHSQIFATWDGGVSFVRVELPMEQVTDLPASGKEYGLTIEDYKYLRMPVQEDDRLTLKVTAGAEEEDGILFVSVDNGKTWQFQK